MTTLKALNQRLTALEDEAPPAPKMHDLSLLSREELYFYKRWKKQSERFNAAHPDRADHWAAFLDGTYPHLPKFLRLTLEGPLEPLAPGLEGLDPEEAWNAIIRHQHETWKGKKR